MSIAAVWQWALGFARYGGVMLAFAGGVGFALLVLGPRIEARAMQEGLAQGRALAIAEGREAQDARDARQIQDRINAEMDGGRAGHKLDGVRCGPSTRDCPDE